MVVVEFLMFSPIAMPELDVPSFTWASCRNPMCANFGIQYEATQHPTSGRPDSDERYKIVSSGGKFRMHCKWCGQSFEPASNRAVRPVARYFLSLSLPFATCKKSSCSNYGVNFFENYSEHDKRGTRSYHGKKKIQCAKCRGSVTPGVSLGLHKQEKGARHKFRSAIETVLLGIRINRSVWWYDLDEGSYYTWLFRAADRLQSYHTWLNAQLLNPNATVDFSSVARVYTDAMIVTLRLEGDAKQYRHMKVILSVLLANRTAYVLAAHPYFLPESFAPVADAPFDDPIRGGRSKEFADKWACIEHPVHEPFELSPEEAEEKSSDHSRWGEGYHLRKGYGEMAHFLVVRKMLQRFNRVCYYMDSAPEMKAASMVALAPDIQARRAEVVLLQRSTKKRYRRAEDVLFFGKMDSEERAAAVRNAWNKREPIVQRKFAEAAEKAAKKNKFPEPHRVAAREFKKALIGAFSTDGEWAWLRFPEPLADKKEWRTLWLTRMPGKTFADVAELLQFATIQPVDSAIGSLRDRVLSHNRPILRAGQGRSFRKNYMDPRVVVSEASIYLIGRNYTYMSKGQKTTPARELRLYASRPPFASVRSLAGKAEKFQLGPAEAEQMTQWLRH